jgi:hypothetical protein
MVPPFEIKTKKVRFSGGWLFEWLKAPLSWTVQYKIFSLLYINGPVLSEPSENLTSSTKVHVVRLVTMVWFSVAWF